MCKFLIGSYQLHTDARVLKLLRLRLCGSSVISIIPTGVNVSKLTESVGETNFGTMLGTSFELESIASDDKSYSTSK